MTPKEAMIERIARAMEPTAFLTCERNPDAINATKTVRRARKKAVQVLAALRQTETHVLAPLGPSERMVNIGDDAVTVAVNGETGKKFYRFLEGDAETIYRAMVRAASWSPL